MNHKQTISDNLFIQDYAVKIKELILVPTYLSNW